MRFLLLLLGAIAAFMIVYKRYRTPPPAPPPPPPILAAPLTPTPVLSPAEIRKVVDSTKDVDPNVRWEAVKFLLQINVPETDGILAEMLARDAEWTLRKNVVNLLAEHRGSKASSLLVGALRDEKAEVRMAALQSLAKAGDYSAAAAISDTLRDVDEKVRLTALAALNSLQTRKNEEIKQQQARQEAARQEMPRKQAEAASHKNK